MPELFPDQIYLPGGDVPTSIKDENGRCWEIAGFEEDIGNLDVFVNAGNMIDNVPCCEECEYDVAESSVEESSWEYPSSSESESYESDESEQSETDDYGYYGYDYYGYYGGDDDGEFEHIPCSQACCATLNFAWGWTKNDCALDLFNNFFADFKDFCAMDCGAEDEPIYWWELCDDSITYTFENGVWTCGYCCQKELPDNDPCEAGCTGATPALIDGNAGKVYLTSGDCINDLIMMFNGNDECVNALGVGWEECGVDVGWATLQNVGDPGPLETYMCGFCCVESARCKYIFTARYDCDSAAWESVVLESTECDTCVEVDWFLSEIEDGDGCEYTTVICGDGCVSLGDCTPTYPVAPVGMESDCPCNRDYLVVTPQVPSAEDGDTVTMKVFIVDYDGDSTGSKYDGAEFNLTTDEFTFTYDAGTPSFLNGESTFDITITNVPATGIFADLSASTLLTETELTAIPNRNYHPSGEGTIYLGVLTQTISMLGYTRASDSSVQSGITDLESFRASSSISYGAIRYAIDEYFWYVMPGGPRYPDYRVELSKDGSGTKAGRVFWEYGIFTAAAFPSPVSAAMLKLTGNIAHNGTAAGSFPAGSDTTIRVSYYYGTHYQTNHGWMGAAKRLNLSSPTPFVTLGDMRTAGTEIINTTVPQITLYNTNIYPVLANINVTDIINNSPSGQVPIFITTWVGDLASMSGSHNSISNNQSVNYSCWGIKPVITYEL